MSELPIKLQQLSNILSELQNNPGYEKTQVAINTVIALLGIETKEKWKLFSDSQGKIRSNAGWFMLAEGFADKRAAYKIADNNHQNIDLKAYWMQTLSKATISWLVALTPNFEDEPFYTNLNIGLDFVIPKEADRIIIVLSKNYAIRMLELKGDLSNTQQDILHKWLQEFDFSNKTQVHNVLWDSFDLEPVNKAFYKGISSFFVELKQHIVEDIKIFDDKNAAFFVNRLIGRIIFCWFLNKKGIINSEMAYFAPKGKTASEYYHEKLEMLFFKVFNTPIENRNTFSLDLKTPFLNGGLFEEKIGDMVGDHRLTFPADFFDRFYQFLHHYNFTTDESTSSFQQVAIDPEMLGRIFENLLAEQVEETGTQARKAKGAFYTPREIVDYMCKESLREYLKTKIPDDEQRDQRIGLLLDVKAHEFRDQQRNYRRDLQPYKYNILKALDELKIIDPACGSGAFPMGMLHLLLNVYERLDKFDVYQKKLDIIKNNLYGVDIEPMAVEIARLRAWLSVIVDETPNPDKLNMGFEPLPNFEFKFVCANSLIPAPEKKEENTFNLDPFFDNLEKMTAEFFSASIPEEKEKKKEAIRKLIDQKTDEKLNAIMNLSTSHLGKEEYKEFFKKKNEKAINKNAHDLSLWESYKNIFLADKPVKFFETKYFFPEVKDGFDVVIGNPPYVSHDKISFKKDLKEKYSSYEPFCDLYCYFIELGINLANENGVETFITSNSYLRANYGFPTRKLISKKATIKSIINIDNFQVFKSAIVNSCIFLYQKGELNKDREAVLVNSSPENITDFKCFIDSNKFFWNQNSFKRRRWTLIPEEWIKICEKMDKFPSLKQLEVQIRLGIATGYNPAFIINENQKNGFVKKTTKNKDIIKKVLRGQDIDRYYYSQPKSYILLTKNEIDVKKGYPDIFKHLSEFGEKFKKRGAKGRHWSNLRACAFFEDFKRPKIIWIELADRGRFALANEEVYLLNSAYFMIPPENIDIKLLLGILNSKIIDFYMTANSQTSGMGTKRWINDIVKTFPLALIMPPMQSIVIRIKSIVDQILTAKKENSKADTTALEREIDQLVYQLYGLTEEEIAVVEGRG